MTALDVHHAITTPTVNHPAIPHLESEVFTCTFCWHVSSTLPRVVGRSARLACEPCYNALLDLSICWVCGEVVVRGDDCVSLGWCFWHKSCYGCLICGNRTVVHGATVKEVFGDEVDHDNVRGVRGLEAVRGHAKEIDEIPLCAHCYVEAGTDEMDARKVVDGVLRRMDHRDGGLSRRRYEDARPSQAGGGTSDRYLQLRNATGPVPLASTIYVSIRDPVAPGFKPSPTKPIPSWMAATPAQDDDRNRHGLGPESMAGEHSRRHLSQAELSLQRRLSTYTPPTDRTARPHTSPPEPVTPPNAIQRPVTPVIATPQPTPVSPINTPKSFWYSRAGFIDSESLKRPSSRLDRIREESSYIDSRTPTPYLTPPEWPVFLYDDKRSFTEHLLASQTQTASVQGPGAKDSIFSETSSQSLASLISPTRTPRLPRLSTSSEPSGTPNRSTMLRARVAAAHQPQAGSHTATIPMSSEFLDRYGLVKGREPPKPSALLRKTPPSSRRSSHEPHQQPILARLARNSRSGPTTGLVDETTVVTETERPSAPKRVSWDSASGSVALHDGPAAEREQVAVRRRSLQAELRNLFRGR